LAESIKKENDKQRANEIAIQEAREKKERETEAL
jgi:hypothetical protein